MRSLGKTIFHSPNFYFYVQFLFAALRGLTAFFVAFFLYDQQSFGQSETQLGPCPCENSADPAISFGTNNLSVTSWKQITQAPNFPNPSKMDHVCIRINGTLLIDITYEFSFCHFVMMPGSAIKVAQQSTLRLNGSKLEGCNYWQGILVETAAFLDHVNRSVSFRLLNSLFKRLLIQRVLHLKLESAI